ncbi:MAG: hypothetical protein IJT54_06675 [Candidatus Methanomethylophilaceae archaeon]|nr:hypothetical protein [Candidatus Methanomethylophilaceae archaeon]
MIIELMKARWQLKNLCEVIRDVADTAADRYVFAEGLKTSDTWVRKIAEYAVAHDEKPWMMSSDDLVRFNLDSDQAEQYFEKEGYPPLPKGRSYDEEDE